MKLFNIPNFLKDKDIFHWNKTNELVDDLNSIEIKEGTKIGTFNVSTVKGDEDIRIHGLGSMAYENKDNYPLKSSLGTMAYADKNSYQEKIKGMDGEIIYHNGNDIFPQFLLNQGWVCETQDELDRCMNYKPSFQDVFNSWPRFRIFLGNNYKDKDDLVALGVLSADNTENRPPAWEYREAEKTVCQPTNSTEYVGFVSPKKYSEYDITVRLYSTSNDDDSIGLVAAYYMDKAGKPHTLSFIRGGGNTGVNWACVVDYCTFTVNNANGQTVLVNNSAKAPNPVSSTYNSTFSLPIYDDTAKKTRTKTSAGADATISFTYGWISNSTSNPLPFTKADYDRNYYKITSGTYAGKYAHDLQSHYASGDIKTWDMRPGTVVRMIRKGNKFTAYCSQFGSRTIDTNTRIDIDLDALVETYPVLEGFMESSQWGYSNFSQPNSMYENIKIMDEIEYIYDLVNWDVWEYRNDKWQRTGWDPLDTLGRGRLSYNNITKKLFFSNGNSFVNLKL